MYLRVKITKCSGGKYWYKDRIGETFTCLQLIDKSYVVTPTGECSSDIISFEDGEVIVEEDEGY